MPIRTNRGRAAVYRRFWGWPMRSPRHLAVVVFVVAVFVLAAGIVIPQLTGANHRPTAGASAATTSGATTAPGTAAGTGNDPGVTGGATSSLPTRITTLTETPTTAPPAPEALDVARSWGQAWVNHPAGVTNAQWIEGLRPYTTEEQLTEMSSVEPANIPASKITGEPSPVESFTSSVKAKLTTDAGDLLVTVIKTPEGWRVAYYEQVDR
ncbi:hypothetical protein [Actinophytocola sp.]|uniref:hypothetical protein n=1 Tax=Actinophytocola sp. TaxID=1872138 RepID=UPI003899D031